MNNNISLKDLDGILVFELSGTEMCTDIKHISCIINPFDVELPILQNQNGYCQIQIKDTLFAYVDLYKLFALERREGTIDSRVLLLSVSDLKIAFFVERIVEIIIFTEKDREQNLKFVKAKDSNYSTGFLKYNSHSYIVPDYYKIAELAAEV